MLRIAGPSIALLVAATSHAATLHVPGDHPTIQQGIDAANPGDTVQIACGTYLEHDIVLRSGVSVVGDAENPQCVIIDAQGSGRVLYGSALDASTHVSGLTIRGGYTTGEHPANAGGGLYLLNSDAVITACRFEGNTADRGSRRVGGGGGAFCDLSSPRFVDCVFEKNHTYADGGGIATPYSFVTLEGCSFFSNSAEDGGGAYLWGRGAEVRGCRFEANEASSSSGAMACAQDVSIFDCFFVRNLSRGGGGALNVGYADPGSVIESSFFHHNVAEGWYGGGALRVRGGELTIRDSSFFENQAPSRSGGAVVIESDAVVNVENCHFERNVGSHGGVFYVRESSLTAKESSFVDNEARYGGALNVHLTTVDLERCTLVRCRSTHRSYSAITLSASSLTARQVVITGSSRGDVVFCHDESELDLACCNLYDNEGGDWGGCLEPFAEQNGNISEDPLFCDASHGDLYLRSGSPCLPEASGSCGIVGRYGEGCRTTIATDPVGMALVVDGAPQVAPVHLDWAPGSVHTVEVAADVQHIEETRHSFTSWSDGGSPAHTVTASTPPVLLAAEYESSHFVTVQADSHGTAAPASGWYAANESVELVATPDPDYRFHRWSGQGIGSYSGSAPVLPIDIRGPTRQIAHFAYDGNYPLTVTADEGGRVSPFSGEYHVGSRLTIAAIRDSGYVFNGWTGTGLGSYTGADSVAPIYMNGPITQHARFDYAGFFPLTMVAEEGGSVTPESAVYGVGSTVTIRAASEPTHLFEGWLGEGSGSYTGADSVVTLTVRGAITQTARFRFEGLKPLTMRVFGGGTVTPESGAYGAFYRLIIYARPDPGYRFHSWYGEGAGSYTGFDWSGVIVMEGPITQTAHFTKNGSFPVTLTTTTGGRTIPESGEHPAGSTLAIRARPNGGYRFSHWEGHGPGSYSGPEPRVTITVDGAITQHGVFTRDGLPLGYGFSISASSTDPFVNSAPPTGTARQLHLWATCNERGLAAFEANAVVTGNLQVFSFNPRPGALDLGEDGDVLIAIGGCPTGSVVLGHWNVLDLGGALCLTPSLRTGTLAAADCEFEVGVYEMPRVVGFSSSSEAAPCLAGSNPCGSEGSYATALKNLEAKVGQRAVVLSWTTVGSRTTAGFHVYRGGNIEGPFERITNELVTGESSVRYRDAAAGGNETYHYKVGALDNQGDETMHGPVSISTPPWAPLVTALAPVHPNPIVGRAQLAFSLASDGQARLSIYDVTGRLVRRIEAGRLAAGDHAAMWDGRDGNGSRVPAGVYFARLETEGAQQTRKVVYLGSR